MIPACLPSSPSVFVALTQALVGTGAGMTHLAASVAVTAVVAQPDLAAAVGANLVLDSIAGAMGSAVAGAIWTQLLPHRLLARVGTPGGGPL
ncbi:hypothetical protein BGZ73_001253 [Actinomortierella ambigua]|nr:hypothetical protein BGZ73_001253 [Actinomortierella ambigua]